MRIPIDIHFENPVYKIGIKEGSNFKLILLMQNEGAVYTSITSFTATLHLYDSIDDVSTYQINSDAVSTSTGEITFNIAPGELPTYGAYRSEIIVKDATANPFAFAAGNVIIRRSILGAVVGALTAGQNIAWSIFSGYTSTAASGPYRAGSNITFSSNVDGSVNVNASAGGGDVTAAAVIADNAIVRGDGGAKGVQDSAVTIADNADVSGVRKLNCTYADFGNLVIEDGIISGSDLNINPAGTKRFVVNAASVVHNSLNQDWDFELKGDNNNNVLYMDASTGRIGIGTATPATLLDVNGAATITTINGKTTDNLIATSGLFGTDNLLLRSDGTGREAQSSLVDVDDSGSITTTGNLSCEDITAGGEIIFSGQFMADLSMGGNKITDVNTPTGSGDAVNKTYADAIASEITTAKISTISLTIDGAGSAITTGVKGYINIPFAATINQVTMLADVSGSAVVDVWKDTYANYPPTVADTITAAAKPTLSAAVKSQDSNLTGWTTSISAGDVLGFNVDSASTITRLHVQIKLLRV